jgi:transglutaminase-like putative cysteine protease
MTRYAVRHETVYAYAVPVEMGLHMLRVTPLNNRGQRSIKFGLTIVPEPACVHGFVDHFGNVVHHVAVETTHARFSATLDAVVEVDRNTGDESGPPWEKVRDAMRSDGFPVPFQVAEFAYPSPLAPVDDAATRYAADSFGADRPIVDAARDLAGRIHRDFSYVPNSTTVATKVDELLATRRGVCQDFAHLMISGLRGLGLPARYVSGYLHTRPADPAAQRLGADASHAWVSLWCGAELGWIGIDPTNDLLVASRHIVVAHGRDFADATPLRGVLLGGGTHTLGVSVTVAALDRDERNAPDTEPV